MKLLLLIWAFSINLASIGFLLPSMVKIILNLMIGNMLKFMIKLMKKAFSFQKSVMGKKMLL